jgi:hypothetical protein
MQQYTPHPRRRLTLAPPGDYMEIPMLSADLIKILDKSYPDRCPALSLSDKEIWYKAGQRSVVNALLAAEAVSEGEIPQVIKK